MYGHLIGLPVAENSNTINKKPATGGGEKKGGAGKEKGGGSGEKEKNASERHRTQSNVGGKEREMCGGREDIRAEKRERREEERGTNPRDKQDGRETKNYEPAKCKQKGKEMQWQNESTRAEKEGKECNGGEKGQGSKDKQKKDGKGAERDKRELERKHAGDKQKQEERKEEWKEEKRKLAGGERSKKEGEEANPLIKREVLERKLVRIIAKSGIDEKTAGSIVRALVRGDLEAIKRITRKMGQGQRDSLHNMLKDRMAREKIILILLGLFKRKGKGKGAIRKLVEKLRLILSGRGKK
jgi:hypothetical protein